MQLARSSLAPWSVDVFRGKNVESVHHVIVSVVDIENKSILSAGDVDQLVYPRSSIKFIQAIPFVESGAFDSYQLSEQNLALACASHHAEDFHMETLKSWLNHLSLNVDDLACGPQIPSHKKTADQLIKQGQAISKLMNNCSGKHLGMLTTALFMKESIKNYHHHEHPVQKRIVAVLSELTGYDFRNASYGVDGCGIPTYVAPLRIWALAMARFLKPQGSEARKTAFAKILNAVTDLPQYVSGTEAFDYKTQKITGRKLILKSGAEGFCCGLLPERSLAFALKVMDGNQRAIPSAVIEIVKDFAQFPSQIESDLETNLLTDIKNTCNEVVGKIRMRKSQ